MRSENAISFFEQALFQSLGQQVAIERYHTLGGGSIHQAVALQTSLGNFFIKYNPGIAKDMFALEAKGLDILRKTKTAHIPALIGVDEDFLLLEWIEEGKPQPHYWEDFGSSLAKLHQHTTESFGLGYDNYIGRLPQYNTPMLGGIDFFIEKRLKVQADQAYQAGQISKNLYQQLEHLYQKLPNLIPDEKPALLHGDLWSGNVMTNAEGLVTLIDPAVYYGLREAELAFTEMFGRFPEHFYRAYHEQFPLVPGYADRVGIYNLYPLLVHVNLFGQSYAGSIKHTLTQLI